MRRRGSGALTAGWRLAQQALLWAILTGLGLYALWPWLPGVRRPATRTIIVYGFSILGEAMNEGIFPAFQALWRARTGEQVEFVSAFAGSGTITNQIILGVPAEVALLALELDALRLVEAGVLAGASWRELPYQGTLNRTPIVVLVRPGNPHAIADFADLTRPSVGVVHPDPLTSGGAQWALLAEYGAALYTTGDESVAFEQLLGIWENVVAQASSARAARTQFETGFGDALVTYEQDVIGDYADAIVYPHSTIFSEHTVVVVDKNVSPAQRDLVAAFVGYLWSDAAQRIFVEHGFRSVDERQNRARPDFAAIAVPFTVGDLGGWPRAKSGIVDAIWRDRILPEVGR